MYDMHGITYMEYYTTIARAHDCHVCVLVCSNILGPASIHPIHATNHCEGECMEYYRTVARVNDRHVRTCLLQYVLACLDTSDPCNKPLTV